MRSTLLALIATVLAGCAQQDLIPNISDQGCVRLRAGGNTKLVNNSWELDDEVGLYVSDQLSNTKYIITETQTGALEPSSLLGSVEFMGEQLSYQAYYPYSQESVVGTTYMVDVADQTDLSAINLVWATQESDQQEVSLQFSHQLSKLTFEISSSKGGSLAGLEAQVNGVYTTAEFNIKTGIFSAQKSNALNMPLQLNEEGTTASAELMVVPTADLSSAYIMFTQGAVQYRYDLSKNQSYEKGEIYPYTIQLTENVTTVPVTSVSMIEENVALLVGGSQVLKADVLPADATNKLLTWASSDEMVATVDQNGRVQAIAEGEATITVTSQENSALTATSVVTVTVPVVDPNAMKFGDYLYTDKTYSTELDETKEVLGVVYKVSEDKRSGYILSIDQATLSWGPNAVENARDLMSGTSNMTTIQALDSDFSTYPAMQWCDAKNTMEIYYEANQMNVWYLPAKKELEVLIASVFKNTTDLGEAFNARITALEGGQAMQTKTHYYSSTSNEAKDNPEYGRYSDNSGSWVVQFFGDEETKENMVRAIMHFELN